METLQVLETHIFHSFLKDRLNRKMDNYTRMEISTRSEMQRYDVTSYSLSVRIHYYPMNLMSIFFFFFLRCRLKATVEVTRRPTMQEIQARRRSSITETGPNKRLGMSLPNLGDEQMNIAFYRNGIIMSDTGTAGANDAALLFIILSSN